MADFDVALGLRATRQIRQVMREAGDIIRMGQQQALQAGMVHRNAGERIERAMRLIDGVIAMYERAGAVAGVPAAAPEPDRIIGPVIPEGGESRRLYLLENPDVALAEARRIEAERQQAQPPAPTRLEDAPPDLQAVIGQAVAAYFERERQAVHEPPPAQFVPPPGFGRTDLEEQIEEDFLVDALTHGQGVNVQAVVRHDLVGPDPERPGWFPVGQIPKGDPIPPVPSTFQPFEALGADGLAHGQLTREELERIEADLARRNPGAQFRPLPQTAPGIVTDNPDEYERILAQRGAHVPAPPPVIAPPPEEWQPESAPAPAAEVVDDGEVVPACPECRFQAKKWVGLQGHAGSKHGFKGNRAELKEWARSGGSASSAA